MQVRSVKKVCRGKEAEAGGRGGDGVDLEGIAATAEGEIEAGGAGRLFRADHDIM